MARGEWGEYFARARERTPLRWFRKPVRSAILDWTIAVVLALAGLADMAFTSPRPGRMLSVWLALLILVSCVCLVRRRTMPVEVLVVTVTVDVLCHALHHRLSPASMQTLFALYACGRYRSARTAWTAAGVALIPELASSLIWPAKDKVASFIIMGLVVALGQYVRLRAELAERRRQEAADVAVRSERRRIARELHDVVAHHISVMSVLVGAARTTMEIDPASAREALTTTEKTAREALAEMRHLLAILRADDADEPDALGARAAQVPDLVASVRKAGVEVELTIDGAARPLPAAVDLAVYRIVQEALTNVRKHAPGARVSVLLRYAPAEVEISVVDDGGRLSGPYPPPPASGYGLGGMAERVALCKGRLQAGPLADGGFAVHAWMPAEPLPPVADRSLLSGLAAGTPDRRADS